MSLKEYLATERERIVSAYLSNPTAASWVAMRREITKLEREFPSSPKRPKAEKPKSTPRSRFIERHGHAPPDYNEQQLRELLATKTWGSERAENYDSDIIEYYRRIGRVSGNKVV